MWPLDSRGGEPARVDFEANGTTSDRGGSVFPEPDDAPLPLGYGSDRLVLMVRDPTSAHAYWDLSNDRINAAIGPHEGGRAFLRLIGVPSGYLLAEYAVTIARGSQDVALPEADSSYMVELGVMRNYQWVVLARSNVIHAPPKTPKVATTPAVVSRPKQPRVAAERHERELERASGRIVVTPAERAPHVAQAAGGPASVGASVEMGSEARLVGVDSGFELASEVRSAYRGSEARLVRREPAHVPFVIAGVLDFQRRWPSRSVRWPRLCGSGAIRSMCSAPEPRWPRRSPTRGSRPGRRSSILGTGRRCARAQPVQVRPDRAVRRSR